jgi:hypothetical protein
MRFRARVSHPPLRAPLVWIRHLGLDGSDVFLASYPRSGNTLLRFPLAEVISGAFCSFENVQRIIPEIGVHVHAYPLLPSGGRMIKTHERFRRKYRRAIYVVRDVRDVLLSSFGREAAMNLVDADNLDRYIEPFMQGKMSRWGSWQDHVEEWLNSPIARSGDLLLFRFEDICKNLEEAVSGSMTFLSMRSTPELVHQACINNSLEQMRRKEAQSQTLPKTNDFQGRLVNSGAVQGWRERLTPRQVALIEQYAGATLACLGYPTGAYSDAVRPNVAGNSPQIFAPRAS